MSIINSTWLFINIIVIVLILIRSPNEQSIQETIGSLKFINNSTNTEKNLDKLICFFIIVYFSIGFLLTVKIF